MLAPALRRRRENAPRRTGRKRDKALPYAGSAYTRHCTYRARTGVVVIKLLPRTQVPGVDKKGQTGR